MPRDADFGEDLAARLTSKYLGFIDEIEFTFDTFVELEQLSESKSYCKVAPNNYEHERESRSVWREAITLQLTLVSVVGAIDDKSRINDWLDSWDKMVRDLREEPLFDKHKPMAVNIDERYDSNLFHNYRRLVTQATLLYQNVEVT